MKIYTIDEYTLENLLRQAATEGMINVMNNPNTSTRLPNEIVKNMLNRYSDMLVVDEVV